MTTLLVILMTIMVGMSAFLSAIETAITASSLGRIQKLKAGGSKCAIILLRILKTKETVISTLLIGNNFINIICTTIATTLFIDLLGNIGTIVAPIVMTFIIIIFGEILPKAIALAKAEQLALFAAPTIMLFLKFFRPINVILDVIIKIFCFIFRINLQQQISSSDEVRGVIEHYHQEGNVYKSDRDMLGGVLDMRNITVSEIMTHRSNIVAINVDLPIAEIIHNALLSNQHTRIPMWKDSQDNIVGILHIRDLLNILYQNNNDATKINIIELINPPWFIPENALVTHQLHAFRERKSHFACVVDEYGDLQGIITLEDILEEIVGPINDEHDYHINTIIKKSENEFIIDGIVTIRDINRELNWNLPDENATTIAGLIIHEIERIPHQGEYIEIFNLQITISKKIANRIDKIQVTILSHQESTQIGESDK